MTTLNDILVLIPMEDQGNLELSEERKSERRGGK